VTTNSGQPAAGATLQLRVAAPVSPVQGFGLPTLNVSRQVPLLADGRYEVGDVTPGHYVLDVLAPGGVSKDIIVLEGQPLRDVDFSVFIAVLSGQITLDDGSPLPDPQVFSDAIVSTVNNPNLILSTVLPLSATGSFASVLEAGEYRFYLRNLPGEYAIQSMRSGTVDLLKETLKITGAEAVSVDIRVARRVEPAAVNVSGVMLDNISGKPPAAERVTLCCRETGPAERLSTRLQADGSFEFQGVPPGKHTVGLQTQGGQPTRHTVDPSIIAVGSEPLTGVKFKTSAGFVQLGARVMVEGRQGPAGVVRIAFVGASGVASMSAPTEGVAIATVPSGDVYVINVDPPMGYAVKSINGFSDINFVTVQTMTQPSSQITIVLERTAP
jgi:hypothetical protein